MLIILFTGVMVAQRISIIWSCCVVIIIGRCITRSGGWRSDRIEKRCSIHRCRSIRINSRSAGTAHLQQPERAQLNTYTPGGLAMPPRCVRRVRSEHRRDMVRQRDTGVEILGRDRFTEVRSCGNYSSPNGFDTNVGGIVAGGRRCGP